MLKYDCILSLDLAKYLGKILDLQCANYLILERAEAPTTYQADFGVRYFVHSNLMSMSWWNPRKWSVFLLQNWRCRKLFAAFLDLHCIAAASVIIMMTFRIISCPKSLFSDTFKINFDAPSSYVVNFLLQLFMIFFCGFADWHNMCYSSSCAWNVSPFCSKKLKWNVFFFFMNSIFWALKLGCDLIYLVVIKFKCNAADALLRSHFM